MPRRRLGHLFLATSIALAIAAAAVRPERARAGACPSREAYVSLMTGAAGDAAASAAPGATTVLRPVPRGVALLAGLFPGTGRTLAVARPADALGGVDGAEPFGIGAELARDGAPSIPLRVELIAPGLARLVPATAPEAGVWQVRAGARALPVELADVAPPAPLPAPALRAVRTRVTPGGVGAMGRPYAPTTHVSATLAGGVPDGAIAVVLQVARGGGWEGALAAPIEAEGRTLSLWTSSDGRCSLPTPGAPPSAGEQVQLVWVDAYGRESTPSRAVPMSRR